MLKVKLTAKHRTEWKKNHFVIFILEILSGELLHDVLILPMLFIHE